MKLSDVQVGHYYRGRVWGPAAIIKVTFVHSPEFPGVNGLVLELLPTQDRVDLAPYLRYLPRHGLAQTIRCWLSPARAKAQNQADAQAVAKWLQEGASGFLSHLNHQLNLESLQEEISAKEVKLILKNSGMADLGF